MIVDEGEVERVIARLERLRSAVIDASSIIYMTKSGYFADLRRTVKLMTIPAVTDEVGLPELELAIVQAPDSREETDRQLFATAVDLRKPLVSEDRAILRKCRETGVEYYNAYMMLLLLRLRRVIDADRYGAYRSRLIEVAHYGRNVLDYAESFSVYLDKSL